MQNSISVNTTKILSCIYSLFFPISYPVLVEGQRINILRSMLQTNLEGYTEGINRPDGHQTLSCHRYGGATPPCNFYNYYR